MYNSKVLLTLFGVMVVVILIAAFKPSEKKQKTIEAGNSFAVVELFTSEGCSSCPPADKLLGDIVKKARAGNQRIFALSFHVDYWDRLGWKDPYSSASFSQRQRSYARALGSGVYTPQMVVNGKAEFVGSNSYKAMNSIENSLAQTSAASVELSNIQATSGQVKLNYNVGESYANNVLNVAVVERGLATDVKRGENSGRTLRHENVVRAFKTLDLNSASGSAMLQLPDNIDASNASVVVYVQNPDSKEIYGAQGKDLGANLSSKMN